MLLLHTVTVPNEMLLIQTVLLVNEMFLPRTNKLNAPAPDRSELDGSAEYSLSEFDVLDRLE